MLKLSGTILFCMTLFCLSAQDMSNIESLRLEYIKALDDSTRIKTMNALAEAYLTINADTALSYAQKARHLASSLGQKNWKSLFLIGYAHSYGKDYDAALDEFSKLLNASDTDRMPADIRRDIYHETGWIYRLLGDNDSSMVNYNRALAISTTTRDTLGMQSDLFLMSNVFADLGQYKRALEGFHQSLEYAESQSNNFEGTCAILNDIARVYVFTKDLDKAEEYFLRAHKMSVQHELITIQQVSYNNLGFIKKEQNEFEAALTYFYEALNYKDNDFCRTTYPLYNIGNIYRRKANYDSALFYLDKAFSQTKECDDTYIITLIEIDRGKLQLEKNNLNQSEAHLLNALKTAQRSRLIGDERDVHYVLSKLYEKRGNYQKAFKSFKNYEQIKDSLFNDDKARELERLENNYNFEKQLKSDEVKRQLTDLENKQALNKAVQTRNYLIIGIVFMLLVSIFSYSNYRRKKNANNLLYKLNQEIKQQKEELITQAENLKRVNQEIISINENLENRVIERTNEIKEQKEKIVDYVMYNSHEVRSPLARILGLINLFEADALSVEEALPSLKNIKESAKELDEMIKKMSLRLEQEKKLQAK